MAFILIADGFRQDAGHQTANGVGDCHGSQFSAGKHKIADGNLLIHALVNKPLVNALIVTADQNQVVQLRQPPCILLTEGLAAGGHINGMSVTADFILHAAPAAIQRVCLHNRALSAAIGIVVHLVLTVGGIVPNLVGVEA